MKLNIPLPSIRRSVNLLHWKSLFLNFLRPKTKERFQHLVPLSLYTFIFHCFTLSWHRLETVFKVDKSRHENIGRQLDNVNFLLHLANGQRFNIGQQGVLHCCKISY